MVQTLGMSLGMGGFSAPHVAGSELALRAFADRVRPKSVITSESATERVLFVHRELGQVEAPEQPVRVGSEAFELLADTRRALLARPDRTAVLHDDRLRAVAIRLLAR